MSSLKHAGEVFGHKFIQLNADEIDEVAYALFNVVDIRLIKFI